MKHKHNYIGDNREGLDKALEREKRLSRVEAVCVAVIVLFVIGLALAFVLR